MGCSFSSLNTISKAAVIGCFGFVIWKGVFARCGGCQHKERLLRNFFCHAVATKLQYQDKIRLYCSYKKEQLKAIIDCLPASSPDEFELKEDLQALDWFISSIDCEEYHCERMYQQFLYEEKVPIPGIPNSLRIGNFPFASSLDRLTIRLLSQDSLEKVFWDNGTTKQKEVLDKLMYKLKTGYPDVSERKLRSSVAYVYNKRKRGVFAGELNKMEKEVKKMLAESRKESEEEEEDGEMERCTICLNGITNERAVTACNHFFHIECIYSWADSEGSCPVCRRAAYPIKVEHQRN